MKKSTRLIKRFAALFLVVLMSIDSIASVIGDNDGPAFLTKSEFERMKNEFNAQIDRYNKSIDNKIVGAISSYIAGLNVSIRQELNNTYSRLGCGTLWLWGNNTGTRTDYPYGGCEVRYWKFDSLANRKGIITYSKNDWVNILMLGNRNDESVALQPYTYKIFVNEQCWSHYKQNATRVYGNRSFKQYVGWENVKRNGEPYFYTTFPASDESHLHWGNIIESFEKSTTSNKSVISINRATNEFYIDRSGDMDGTIVEVTIYTGKGTDSGNFPSNDNQTYVQKWRPSWGKYKAHNQLRVQDFEQYTSREEKIISGAPVTKIESNFDEVTITYKANAKGTLYIYNSVAPIKYSDLVDDNERIQIENVTIANTNKTVTLHNLTKDTWIRVMFLPNTGTATLTISQIIGVH